jgi:hypothetical protein
MDHNLRDVLMPLAILGTFGGVVIFFARTITDYILKKRLIDKGLVNEEGLRLFKKDLSVANKLSSLKWGLIILFGGLSLVLLEFLPYDSSSTLPYGMVAFFVAVGFLIYYYVVRKEEENGHL